MGINKCRGERAFWKKLSPPCTPPHAKTFEGKGKILFKSVGCGKPAEKVLIELFQKFAGRRGRAPQNGVSFYKGQELKVLATELARYVFFAPLACKEKSVKQLR